MTTPLSRLIAGFRGFHAIYYEQRPERIEGLIKEGQKPGVLMIACSDSRVDPAILMNVEPGEIFMVRNVANLVPPYSPDGQHHGVSAAIEYAVRDLKVSHIVVLGHSRCGGIQALIQGAKGDPVKRDFIGPWMDLVDCCSDHSSTHEVEKAAIKTSLANLMTFPWIKERVAEGNLDIRGWWFEIERGELWSYDKIAGDFARMV